MAEFRTIDGVEELQAVLEQLGPRVEQRVMRAAMQKVAPMLISSIEARAMKLTRTRKRTGDLVASIGLRLKSYAKRGNVFVAVGPLWPKGAHGWLVEHGHRMVAGGTIKRIRKSEWIAGITAKGKRFLEGHGLKRTGKYWITPLGEKIRVGESYRKTRVRGGGKILGEGLEQREVQGYPFTEPAFRQISGEMLTEIIAYARQRVEKESNRLAKELRAIVQ